MRTSISSVTKFHHVPWADFKSYFRALELFSGAVTGYHVTVNFSKSTNKTINKVNGPRNALITISSTVSFWQKQHTWRDIIYDFLPSRTAWGLIWRWKEVSRTTMHLLLTGQAWVPSPHLGPSWDSRSVPYRCFCLFYQVFWAVSFDLLNIDPLWLYSPGNSIRQVWRVPVLQFHSAGMLLTFLLALVKTASMNTSKNQHTVGTVKTLLKWGNGLV